MRPQPQRHVHLLFKTHLDIGFTDAAATVVQGYLEHYLPKAIALAHAMRSEGSDRFVWTVGSWLVHTALERLRGRARTDLESALAAGDIRWHGLPFTMHSEYFDAGLIRHGLSLSAALDRRFGKQTRSAKMTDVPGHTQALVPLLVEAGIELLHIGVNPASTRPHVPPWCRWRCAGAEIILGYDDDYGGVSEPLAHGPAISFGFTGDNHGPPEMRQIQDIYLRIRQRFPDAMVAATSLDDFAAELQPRAAELPLITEELGDTWIHGTGTDPEKTRRFRALSRWRRDLIARQPQAAARRDVRRFSDSLLVVGEHTWGRDSKYFPAEGPGQVRGRWDAAGFHQDRLSGMHDELEASWQEQRAYIETALSCLAGSPLEAEARQACAWPNPDPGPWHSVDTSRELTLELAGWRVQIDAHGSLCDLRRPDGAVLADAQHRLGCLRYHTYGAREYEAFVSAYNPRLAATRQWAIPDFGKPGLESVCTDGAIFLPKHTYAHRHEDGRAVRLDLEFSADASEQFGCPRRWQIFIRATEESLTWELRWGEKTATRIPEALWLGFHPLAAGTPRLLLGKLGQAVNASTVIAGGNQRLHHCEEVHWQDDAISWRMDLPDGGLVAPGGGALVQFAQEKPDLARGFDVNLLNTTWGTNFPLWYDDDGIFRCTLDSGRTHDSRERNNSRS